MAAVALPAASHAEPYAVQLQDAAGNPLWGGYIGNSATSRFGPEYPNESWYVDLESMAAHVDATPGSMVNFWVSRPVGSGLYCQGVPAEFIPRVDRSGPIAVSFPAGSNTTTMNIPPYVTVPEPVLSEQEQEFVGRVNAERAEAGVAPLRINRFLTMAADMQASFIKDHKYLTHCGFNASDPWERLTWLGGPPNARPAEGAYYSGTLAATALASYTEFRGSALHRAIYMAEGAEYIGISIDGGAAVMETVAGPGFTDDYGVGTPPPAPDPPDTGPNATPVASRVSVSAKLSGISCVLATKPPRRYVCKFRVLGAIKDESGKGLMKSLTVRTFQGLVAKPGKLVVRRVLRSNAAGAFVLSAQVALPPRIRAKTAAKAYAVKRFGRSASVSFVGDAAVRPSSKSVNLPAR